MSHDGRTRVKFEIDMRFEPKDFPTDPRPAAAEIVQRDPVWDSRESQHERTPGETGETLQWRLERVSRSQVVSYGRKLRRAFPAAKVSASKTILNSDWTVKGVDIVSLEREPRDE
jgi:hypothetical protein